MGAISDKFSSAFRRYVTPGVPGSGVQNPNKDEIVAAAAEVDSEVAAINTALSGLNALIAGLATIGAGGTIGYATASAMNADLLHADGTLAVVAYLTDPTNAGTYKKSGASGSGSWVAFSSTVDVLAPYINKTIHINPAASGGGAGTVASPYNGADAIAAVNADTARGALEIILKHGVMRFALGATAPFRFSGNRWREITIRTALGMNADIYCSEAILSGSAAFTQPDAGGNPNVWMVTNKWNNTSGSTAAPGGLIDLSSSSACGRSGVFRSPSTIYTNIGNDIAIATINSTAYRGCYSLQTTGLNAGKVLVHALADANPNTITFERSLYDYGIWSDTPLGTDFNGCRINLSGVRVFYAQTSGIWIDRAQVDVENVTAGFCHNYGFQFNQCDGIVAESLSQYTASDGFNGNGGIADASAPDHNAKLLLIGNKVQGVQQMVVPPVLGQLLGDGFSNHKTQEWHLIDCRVEGATKDGGSMIDSCRFNNFYAEDCTDSGIKLASVSGTAITAEVFGGRLKGNHTGIMSTTGTGNPAGSTATVNARNVILDSTSDRDLYATGDQTCIINAIDCRFMGSQPATGHFVQDTSGSIVPTTSSEAADAGPQTKTGTSYIMTGRGDTNLIINASGTFTLTLPSAVGRKGQGKIYLKSIAAQAVNSASSNVAPLTSATAGTAILAATSGKWAVLESDDTNWIVKQGN